MTKPELTHEEATAACFAIAKSVGEHHARRIMTRTVMFALDPDDMEAMVHESVADFRAFLLRGGADPHDADVAAQHVYVALVKEGARLSRTMTWEAGNA